MGNENNTNDKFGIKDLVTFEINGKKCVALVRKLTERECGRLMGVDDNDITTIQNSGVSRTGQYKLYGNSIVVDVLYHIFRMAFIPVQNNESNENDLFQLQNNDNQQFEFNHDRPLRIATLCSGYDSQCLALERLKRDFPPFDYELVWWSEFDPETPNRPLEQQPAVMAHNALFPQWSERNLGDMTKIDWSKCAPIDFLFYSTPCQSISQAGLQHGFTEGSGTRSSIIWNVRDALATLKPKYACLENVSAMVSKKFLPMFNLWRSTLGEIGYSSFAQKLNAKFYGVPQNRDRIFMFSVYDPEHNASYTFPQQMPLNKKLRDVLEDCVDTKYYLNPEKVQKFVKDNLVMIEGYAKEDDGEIEPLPDNLREWIENYGK